MADYYVKFAACLNLKPDAVALVLVDVRTKYSEAFRCTAYDGGIHLEDIDGCADIAATIEFVVKCAKDSGLTGCWGFQYAETCSEQRYDGFGGGAVFIDFDHVDHPDAVQVLSTHQWLTQLREEHISGSCHD